MMRFPMVVILALPLLAAAPVPEAPAQLGRFGDFTYEASTYAVEGEGGRYTVRNRRERDDDQMMIVTIRDAPVSECSMAKLQAEAAGRRGDRADQRQRMIFAGWFRDSARELVFALPRRATTFGFGVHRLSRARVLVPGDVDRVPRRPWVWVAAGRLPGHARSRALDWVDEQSFRQRR